jgi:hypothetical protein
MNKLIAVQGDEVYGETGGELQAVTQSKVYIMGKLAVVDGDFALPVDDEDEPEADPTSFSSKVFIGGDGVHREEGDRENGYQTKVVGNTKIYAG